MKCIVYNIEDPEAKEFTVCVNEKHIHAQTGVEIDLKPEYIHALENAKIDTTVRNPETNKAEPYKKLRFRIIKCEPTTEKPQKTITIADNRLDDNSLVCVYAGCDFVAKSNAGKVAHERSHQKEAVPV